MVNGVASVGLTGSVGAGKSTALAAFADLGARTLSADAVVHALYASPEICAVLHARFGSAVVGCDGSVDRKALAQRVLGDEEALRWLEALVHPRVGHEVRDFLRRSPVGSVVVCEVPLLVEAQMRPLFDIVVTVEAPVELREARAGGRLGPFFPMLNARQATPEQRAAVADFIFVNDGPVEALREFVALVFRNAKALLDRELREMLRDDRRGW
ncbi:MAG: dephospho-CoA kinase [Actinobacteria bacterium]|nr:dephospho-CoA kinase [Actinomycetota bacterium]